MNQRKHGAGHDHRPHLHIRTDRREQSRRLGWVLGLTGVFMVVEVVGGLLSGSLALLADAGHMFSDAGALALSLVAMRMAQRPPTPSKTFGYVRMEILAALANGATLLVISGFILREAWVRFDNPVAVDAPVMLGVAVVGLAVNIVGALLLHGHAHDNLNLRGAYLHVLGDLLGSLGAITAAVVIAWTGWTAADPLVSVVIAGLIVLSAWRLVREAIDVLLEGAPAHMDVADIVAELARIPGLDDVHHVHVWTLTSGFVALSGHGVTDHPEEHARILQEVRDRMEERGIGHVTFQLEMRPLVQLVQPGAASDEACC